MSVCAEMLTEVAANTMPRNTACVVVYPNGSATAVPSPIGTRTPSTPLNMAGLPARRKSESSISNPAARLGALSQATAEKPEASSGREVTPASRIAPTHARPSPVFSASTSP